MYYDPDEIKKQMFEVGDTIRTVKTLGEPKKGSIWKVSWVGHTEGNGDRWFVELAGVTKCPKYFQERFELVEKESCAFKININL